jgi:hypothetical protein
MVDEKTPPGEYESEVMINGVGKKVKFNVLPSISADVLPSRMSFVGCLPGARHVAEALFINRGNIPLALPEGEIGGELTANAVCGSLTRVLRGKGDAGATAALETFMADLKKEIASIPRISCEEAGRVVEPGESVRVRLVFVVPEAPAAKKTYEGEFNIYNQKLTYRIIAEVRTKPKKPDKEA